MADYILSCDWGTTSFRLRLVQVSTGEVVAETRAGQGISAVYDEWLATRLPESARLSFYQSKLIAAIGDIGHAGIFNAPIFISGMASSGLGMYLTAYGQLPFPVSAAQLPREHIPASAAFPHDIYLVSGLMTSKDIMRGEETILVGIYASDDAYTVIFPGTHSKHAFVVDKVLVDFSTYMTGEIFGLLANKSILSRSVQAHDGLSREDFCAGVLEGASGNILHTAFHVRTRQLLDGKPPEGNYDFLSGLLIGQELGYLSGSAGRILLVSGQALSERYTIAADLLGLSGRLAMADADQALVRAHLQLHAKTG